MFAKEDGDIFWAVLLLCQLANMWITKLCETNVMSHDEK